MKRESTIPMVRASCETCGASFAKTGGQPDFTERVARARQWAEGHAREERHNVFVEKVTGTMFRGVR